MAALMFYEMEAGVVVWSMRLYTRMTTLAFYFSKVPKVLVFLSMMAVTKNILYTNSFISEDKDRTSPLKRKGSRQAARMLNTGFSFLHF